MNSTVSRRALIIDVETTGLDPTRHACVELGAILLDEKFDVVWEYSSLLEPWPGAEFSAEALKVHRIRSEVSQDAEPLEKVVRAFHQRFDREAAPLVVAGWNVWFDVSFLKVLYERTGLAWPFGHRFLDVQSIVSFFFGLREVSQAFAIEKCLGETQIHRALADARQTVQLLRLMNRLRESQHFSEIQPSPLRQSSHVDPSTGEITACAPGASHRAASPATIGAGRRGESESVRSDPSFDHPAQ